MVKMDAPTPLTEAIGPFVDRESSLLKLNKELDDRFQSIINSRPSSVKSAKRTKSPKPAQKPTLATITPNDILRKPFVYREPSSEIASSTARSSLNDIKSIGSSSSSTNPASSLSSLNLARLQLNERKQLSAEVNIKCLKAKVSLLQQELEAARAAQIAQQSTIDKLHEASKVHNDVVDRLKTRNADLSELVNKLQASAEIQANVLKGKTSNLAEVTRELESRTGENAKLKQSNAKLDGRLSKSIADHEIARRELQAAVASEQESIRQHRLDQRAAEAQVKQLSDQRNGLIAAYKRQMFLIDNLRRQVACLEQTQLVAFAEKDFVRILESKSKKPA